MIKCVEGHPKSGREKKVQYIVSTIYDPISVHFFADDQADEWKWKMNENFETKKENTKMGNATSGKDQKKDVDGAYL